MTKKSTVPLLDPYSENGSLLQYTVQPVGTDQQPETRTRKGWDDKEYSYRVPGIFWKPREPFQDTLKFVDLYDGRSALGVIWENADGARFPMFAKDFRDILTRGKFTSVSVSGTWLVRKNGANYGVTLVMD